MRTVAILSARRNRNSSPADKANIHVGGVPLFLWALDSALRAGLDEVYMDTEDEQMAEMAARAGATVPDLRPVELSSDSAISYDYHSHAAIRAELDEGDVVVWLQASTPCIEAVDIQGVLALHERSQCSVVYPLMRSRPLLHQGPLAADDVVLWRPNTGNRQNEAVNYILCGSPYVCTIAHLFHCKGIHGDRHSNVRGYVIPRERGIDIDDEMDFVLAERTLKTRTFRPASPYAIPMM